jgi:hypothetical protein
LACVARLRRRLAGGRRRGCRERRGPRNRPEPGGQPGGGHRAEQGCGLELQRTADNFGIEFNDHYLGKNANGTFTVTVFGSEGELAALAEAGYELGTTIEGPATWEANLADMRVARRAEVRASEAALGDPPVIADDDELVILRADYFENYAGRFLSVEAKDRLGGSTPTG